MIVMSVNRIELFERRLLCATLDASWFRMVWADLLPEYFEIPAHRSIARVISNHYQETKQHIASTDELYNVCAIAIPKELEAVSVVLDGIDVVDGVEIAKSSFVQWITEQAAKNAVLDSIDDVKSGNLSLVVERMKQAMALSDVYKDPGIDVFRDVDQWVYDANHAELIPTGFIHPDIYLRGGMARGEIGVVLGPSNRGKSLTLANIAYGAAGIGSAKDVLIISHEMSATAYAQRFGARILFKFPADSDNPEQYSADFQTAARTLLRGSVRIVKFKGKTKPNMLEQYVERLKDEGFVPDVIIDDYLDLLYPETSRSEKRFELSDNYRWFRDWCGELDCVGWTASQSTRDSYDREIITEKDMAEDIGKVGIADVVVALCQTRKEAQNNQARLYFAKVRDRVMRGGMFDMKYYPKQQALISIGHTKTEYEKDGNGV